MAKEEVRKGTWTEQEDAQLVLYVNLFGERKWDHIAKVSGLRRSGKSCRLRWVNYLRPGLKRDKLTPYEELLILELHNKWGNRWSRIAQNLPGRTDNEIKNYWRARMRNKAQERKRFIPPLSSLSSSSSSWTKEVIPNSPSPTFTALPEAKEHSFYDTQGVEDQAASPRGNEMSTAVGESTCDSSMDEIWKDIELSEEGIVCTRHTIGIPMEDLCSIDSLWPMDEEESNIRYKAS